MNFMAADKKSHNCLEGDVYPATDNYFNLQSIYTHCLEGEYMRIPWNKGKKRPEMSGDRNPSKRPEVKKKISEANHGKKSTVGSFKKGHSVSAEVREKLSKSSEGKHHSQLTEFKSGIIPWNKGKKRPEISGDSNPSKRPEVRKKISEANHNNKSRLGMHNSPEHCRNISKSKMGELNPIWNGGTSFLPYCRKFNNTLKERVRDRDNRTCQLCNEKENGTKLSVHHIHYDKENCYPDLIAVCRKCNTKVNSNREYYERIFMNKLNERGLLFWTRE